MLATDETLITHYPSLSKLAEIILLYPLSTAEVERGFSYQNAMKTKFCNRLNCLQLTSPYGSDMLNKNGLAVKNVRPITSRVFDNFLCMSQIAN